MTKFEKFKGWIIKNKWGSFLPWTLARTRKEVIENLGKERYQIWKKMGHEIVKVTVSLKEEK